MNNEHPDSELDGILDVIKEREREREASLLAASAQEREKKEKAMETGKARAEERSNQLATLEEDIKKYNRILDSEHGNDLSLKAWEAIQRKWNTSNIREGRRIQMIHAVMSVQYTASALPIGRLFQSIVVWIIACGRVARINSIKTTVEKYRKYRGFFPPQTVDGSLLSWYLIVQLISLVILVNIFCVNDVLGTENVYAKNFCEQSDQKHHRMVPPKAAPLIFIFLYLRNILNTLTAFPQVGWFVSFMLALCMPHVIFCLWYINDKNKNALKRVFIKSAVLLTLAMTVLIPISAWCQHHGCYEVLFTKTKNAPANNSSKGLPSVREMLHLKPNRLPGD